MIEREIFVGQHRFHFEPVDVNQTKIEIIAFGVVNKLC
jgi:hypothetical protein